MKLLLGRSTVASDAHDTNTTAVSHTAVHRLLRVSVCLLKFFGDFVYSNLRLPCLFVVGCTVD